MTPAIHQTQTHPHTTSSSCSIAIVIVIPILQQQQQQEEVILNSYIIQTYDTSSFIVTPTLAMDIDHKSQTRTGCRIKTVELTGRSSLHIEEEVHAKNSVLFFIVDRNFAKKECLLATVQVV